MESAEEFAREFVDHPNVVAALRGRIEARDAAVALAAKMAVLEEIRLEAVRLMREDESLHWDQTESKAFKRAFAKYTAAQAGEKP